MTDTTQSAPAFAGVPARLATPRAGYLFSPWFDFFCLGGGSVLILGLIVLLLPRGIPTAQEGALIVLLMTLINQPHFAHSYQMFYRNFGAKAFGTQYARGLRLRYIVAGLVVPAGLILFLGAAVVSRDEHLLSYGANLMFFLVGWHYVKQGYGILIVDSVQKRALFSDRAKTIFRLNGYACWMVAWLALNHALAKATPYLGLVYYSFPVPTLLYDVAIAAASLSTLAALAMFADAWRHGKNGLPWNGVIAYLTTLYLWLVFVHINPLVLIVVPTFHSLQYLAVVWRYQLNEGAARKLPAAGVWRNLAVFVIIGMVLGYLGFAGVPRLLDEVLSYDKHLFGPSLCVFVAYIFINVHHYFLDNVMWRRGNPDVQQYIFTRPAARPAN